MTQTKLERLIRKEALIRRLPYPLLSFCLHTFIDPYNRLRHERSRRYCGLQDAPSCLDLGSNRRSDTVFILGSGWSINNISESKWKTIKNHDSFGFNLWLRHAHVPSMYFSHVPDTRSANEMLLRCFIKLMEERAQDYKAVPKFIPFLHNDPTHKFINAIPKAWRQNLYAINTFTAVARSAQEVNREISNLLDNGWFRCNPTGPLKLFSYIGTIIQLMDLSVRMGYRRVILCGVDMSDPRYFYEDLDQYPDMAGIRSSPPTQTTHQTLKQTRGHIPIDQVVYAMNDLVFEPNEIKLYVEHAGSALYPRIPLAPPNIYD